MITVRDSGPGLDPKCLDRLFDVFYTTKPQGLGMGLTISRSIVEAHGGRLRPKANTPRDAIFEFTLPIGDATLFVSIFLQMGQKSADQLLTKTEDFDTRFVVST